MQKKSISAIQNLEYNAHQALTLKILNYQNKMKFFEKILLYTTFLP